MIVFKLGRAHQPPKYDKALINDFLADIMTKYDRVLIVVDFNIHVCRSDKLLVKDFLTLIHSFNLVQCITGHTHKHRQLLNWTLLKLCFLITILFYLISLILC